MTIVEREVMTRVLYEALMARIEDQPVDGALLAMRLERGLMRAITRTGHEGSRYSHEELTERIQIAQVVVVRVARELRAKK